MALGISKTQIVDDDYPEGGSVQRLRYDPITDIPEYVKIYSIGSYDLDGGSWSGTRFGVGGGYPTAQLYGVVQIAALEMPHNPFVVHQAAGFPFDPDWVNEAYVNISGGTITQYREDVEWRLTDDPPTAADNPYQINNTQYTHFIGGTVQKWHWLKQVVTEVPTTSGIMGLAAIVKEASGLIARPILTSGVLSNLEAGVLDAVDVVKAMRTWSTGKCFGFEWFLLPGSATILSGAGTETGLDGVLNATSYAGISQTTYNGETHLTGSAWCAWVEYSGCQFTNGRVTFSEFELPSGSRTPEAWPPRMD